MRPPAALQLFYNYPVFLKLLMIFIVVPLLELFVIIEVSSRVGLAPTILTLLVISLAGAALAKREGYNAVARIQEDVRGGRMPGDSLIDGALVLSGGLLLLTPGFITDAAGLLLLLPPSRKLARAYVRRRLERAVARRTITIYTPRGPGNHPDGGDEPEQYRRELGE